MVFKMELKIFAFHRSGYLTFVDYKITVIFRMSLAETSAAAINVSSHNNKLFGDFGNDHIYV